MLEEHLKKGDKGGGEEREERKGERGWRRVGVGGWSEGGETTRENNTFNNLIHVYPRCPHVVHR